MNKNPNILVVGSLVLDQIMSTDVFPKAGQTVLGKAFHKAPGGKGGNQAVQMARLGANVTFFGKVGQDSNGAELLQACRDAGVDVSRIAIDPTTPSACAVIILEERPDKPMENRIVVYPGANMRITPEEVDFLESEMEQYDMVVLQLEIPMEVNIRVAECARAHHVPVMLNSAPSAPLPKRLLACLTYLSPNETEAEDLTGVHISHQGHTADLEAAELAADMLLQQGIEHVLITLGSAGAVLFCPGERYAAPCAEGITAVDPTAAGDSFIGAFCYAVCRKMGWQDALTFANHAAGLTVSGMGAMPSLPDLAAVDGFLKSRGMVLPTEAGQ